MITTKSKKKMETRCRFKNEKNECGADIMLMQCIYTNRGLFLQEEDCGLFEKKIVTVIERSLVDYLKK